MEKGKKEGGGWGRAIYFGTGPGKARIRALGQGIFEADPQEGCHLKTQYKDPRKHQDGLWSHDYPVKDKIHSVAPGPTALFIFLNIWITLERKNEACSTTKHPRISRSVSSFTRLNKHLQDYYL